MKLSKKQKKLCEDHFFLVEECALLFERKHPICGRRISCRSIANEAICLAAIKYDPDRGPFVNFAQRVISNEMFAALRHIAGNGRRTAIYAEPLTSETREAISQQRYKDEMARRELNGSGDEVSKMFDAALTCLTPKERSTYRCLYILDMTSTQTAKHLKVDFSTIKRRHNKIKEIVRQFFEQ